MAGTDSTQESSALEGGLTARPAVVLVRPQLAENIGATARAMANCALTDLRLVAPRDGWPNPKAIPMASGATDILDNATVFETLAEALADRHLAWATSARPRSLVKRVTTAKGAARSMADAVRQGLDVAVVFGPERTGLEMEEVSLCHELVEIPLNPGFSSLNLAQAVLLLAYEWYQATSVEDEKVDATEVGGRAGDPGRLPAPMAQVYDFLDHLDAQLDVAGFFRHELMRPAMMRNLQAFIMRAEPTDQDIRTLHGVISVLSGKRRHQLRPRPGEGTPADEQDS